MQTLFYWSINVFRNSLIQIVKYMYTKSVMITAISYVYQFLGNIMVICNYLFPSKQLQEFFISRFSYFAQVRISVI